MRVWYCFFQLIFLFFIPNFIVAQNPISLPTEYKQQPFDILHYDATIDLTKGMEKKISGVCKIKFLWTQHPNGKKFYFHLRGLNVDSVLYNSKRIPFSLEKENNIDYTYYSLANLEGDVNDTAIATIYYSGIATNEGGKAPFGGVFLIDSVLFVNGVGFNNEYVSATQHWLPCYDHPSDKATFRFTFIHPIGFQIASNGRVEQSGLIGDSARFIVFSSQYPIATYLMTFAMGKFKKSTLDTWNLPSNIVNVVYYLPEDEEAVNFAFKNYYKYFYSLQNRFGRYPFEKIGYVVVPFENGAMEHQTMITFPRNYVQTLYANRDTNNIMALHELSHQWFGNSVSPLDFRDAWFNESFATYSEAIYQEMMFGQDAYLRDLLRKKNYYLGYVAKNEGLLPLYGYSRKPPSSNYPSTIYVKGAVVVGMLRYHLGDELFFDLIRNYLDYFAYQSRSTNDFLNFTTAYTMQHLFWFFQQWIFQPGYPMLEFRVTQYVHSPKRSSALINIRQVQPQSYGSYSNIPIELNFQLSNNRNFDTVVTLMSNEQSFWFDTLPPFVSFNTNLGRKVVSLFSSNIYTSVEEYPENDLVVYFSKEEERVVLKLDNDCNNVFLTLTDIFGRTFSVNELINSNGTIAFDVSEYPNGLYILSLKCENRIVQTKFLKY
ncbi:MAG: M1 family aminopeptidase [Ignavibacteria bacterium]|nr:M1 family aminopeptidase [Ignavibacteria bacterium]